MQGNLRFLKMNDAQTAVETHSNSWEPQCDLKARCDAGLFFYAGVLLRCWLKKIRKSSIDAGSAEFGMTHYRFLALRGRRRQTFRLS